MKSIQRLKDISETGFKREKKLQIYPPHIKQSKTRRTIAGSSLRYFGQKKKVNIANINNDDAWLS